MIRRLFLGLVVTVAASAASPSGAQRVDCKVVTGNLLAKSNCGFDKDVAGWTAIPDTSLAHLPAADGDPTSAAMRVTSSAQGSLSAVSACVPVKGGASYRFSARVRTVSGAPFFCALNVWQSSDQKCAAGQEPLGSDGRPPAQTWAALEGTAVTRANATAALIRTDCSGQGAIVIAWDDFVLAPSPRAAEAARARGVGVGPHATK